MTDDDIFLLKRGKAYETTRGHIFKHPIIVVPLTFVHIFSSEYHYSMYTDDTSSDVYLFSDDNRRGGRMSLKVRDINEICRKVGFKLNAWMCGCDIKAPSGYDLITIEVDLPDINKVSNFCALLRAREEANSIQERNTREMGEREEAERKRRMEDATVNLKKYYCGKCNKYD
jgi:hypothetical protein